MAQNGRRQELGQAARHFSWVDTGETGREVRTGSPGFGGYQADPGGHSARPAGNDYGLVDLYSKTANQPVPDVADPYANRPYSRLFDSLGPPPGSQSDRVADWQDLLASPSVSAPGRPDPVGDDDEVVWHSMGGVAGVALVAGAAWRLIKRYPVPAALWAVVAVLWFVPHLR